MFVLPQGSCPWHESEEGCLIYFFYRGDLFTADLQQRLRHTS
ncbi:MAG: hypothetical protein AAF191_03965 [Verrucomicrobiota bacterium]